MNFEHNDPWQWVKKILENTEGAIKNGQSGETGNIGYTRQRKTKQKHHYTQTNTSNVELDMSHPTNNWR